MHSRQQRKLHKESKNEEKMRKKRGNLCALHNAYDSETETETPPFCLYFNLLLELQVREKKPKPTLFISSLINSQRRWVVRVAWGVRVEPPTALTCQLICLSIKMPTPNPTP